MIDPAIDLSEDLVEFRSGARPALPLYGILHRPPAGTAHQTGVVLLGGWSGTRVGPHGILVSLARKLADCGFATLRFDYRGRGDSGGTQADAHIGTMVEDVATAVDFLYNQIGARKVVLVGVCAGAMVAMGAAPLLDGLVGMVLWSPPPFHPDAPVESSASEASIPEHKAGSDKKSDVSRNPTRSKRGGRRGFAMLKEYWRKLFDPRTWAKFAGGQLQPRVILKVLLGKPVRKQTAPSDTRDNWAGPKPNELAYELALPSVTAPALFVYGSNDPEKEEATAYYTRLRAGVAASTQFHVVDGANHSFYSLAWRQEVLDRTLRWITENSERNPAAFTPSPSGGPV